MTRRPRRGGNLIRNLLAIFAALMAFPSVASYFEDVIGTWWVSEGMLQNPAYWWFHDLSNGDALSLVMIWLIYLLYREQRRHMRLLRDVSVAIQRPSQTGG